MLRKRIIPCLDVKDGQVVKGVNFKGLRTVGDPVELAKDYYRQGADEITFLDISASLEGRGTMLDIVRRTADQVFIPLTVGGGVRSVEDVNELLRAGADKISINSSAIRNPQLIKDISDHFGSQVVVLSVDAHRASDHSIDNPHFTVTTHGGTVDTGIDMTRWIKLAESYGAGEILLNSMDADGTKSGFDLEMTQLARETTNLPIIASGGAGKLDDFAEVFQKTDVDAVLAASVFHNGELTISDVRSVI